MTEMFNSKTRIAIVAMACLLLCCAGSQQSQYPGAQQSVQKTGADSLTTITKNGEIHKIETVNGQYLRVKFRQNDTEVDMVLDPKATNLALDLRRGPDGLLKVSKGDSVLYDNQGSPEELLNELRGLKDARHFENMTDEVIRDISLAQKLFYERRYEEALKVLKSSLKKEKTATAYALGGSIYYVNGDIEQAVLAWENALKIKPDMTEVRDLLVRYKN